MAVKLDNLDEVIDQLAKMENAVALEIIREARTKMRAIMRANLPKARKASPVGETGILSKSPKVKSRSRRGRSTAQVVWDIKEKKPEKKDPIVSAFGIKLVKSEPKKKGLVNYSGVVNFNKDQSASGFASDLWQNNKEILDQEGLSVVKDTFKNILEKYGVKVENK